MNTYTPTNLPKSGSGNGKKIWEALNNFGFNVKGLWYNPNCWGASQTDNLCGTWMFEETIGKASICGVHEGVVYVENSITHERMSIE